MYKTRIPSKALSLNSFHAVRYYSKVVPSYDAAAVTNQNISVHFPSAVPKVSKFLPQHYNSVLGQTCSTHPNCLVSFLESWIRLDSFIPAIRAPGLHFVINTPVRSLLDWGQVHLTQALIPHAAGLISRYPELVNLNVMLLV